MRGGRGDPGVLYVTKGDTPLPKGGVRTERYRIRAAAGGPTGYSPIGVYGVITGLPQDAPFEARGSGHVLMPVDMRAR